MVRGKRAARKSGARAGLLLPALFLCATCWWGCTHPRLIVQDSEVVSWTPINNTFNTSAGHVPWDGLLIQVGDYLEAGKPYMIFDSVTFEKGGTPLRTLKRGDFEWINIVAVDPKRTDPMDATHLPLMYPKPGTSSGCSSFDECAMRMCSCATPPCAPTGYEPLGRCLRARSLHGTFTPFAVITYWQGPKGVDTEMRPGKLGLTSQFTFSFQDEIRISVDGNPLDLGGIDTIRVVAREDLVHGTSDDPPWYP